MLQQMLSAVCEVDGDAEAEEVRRAAASLQEERRNACAGDDDDDCALLRRQNLALMQLIVVVFPPPAGASADWSGMHQQPQCLQGRRGAGRERQMRRKSHH
jgi:hypothetical protein